MKFDEICDFRDLIEYAHSLEKRIEKQQKEITKLKIQLQTQKGFLYFAHKQIMKSDYISKDKKK